MNSNDRKFVNHIRGDLCSRLQQVDKERQEISIRKSTIEGHGLVINIDVDEGKELAKIKGDIIKFDEAIRRCDIYKQKGGNKLYIYKVGDLYIDSTDSKGISKFLNHSCSPNCYLSLRDAENPPVVDLVSLKAITKGEELTINYGGNTLPDIGIECLCGTRPEKHSLYGNGPLTQSPDDHKENEEKSVSNVTILGSDNNKPEDKDEPIKLPKKRGRKSNKERALLLMKEASNASDDKKLEIKEHEKKFNLRAPSPESKEDSDKKIELIRQFNEARKTHWNIQKEKITFPVYESTEPVIDLTTPLSYMLEVVKKVGEK